MMSSLLHLHLCKNVLKHVVTGSVFTSKVKNMLVSEYMLLNGMLKKITSSPLSYDLDNIK